MKEGKWTNMGVNVGMDIDDGLRISAVDTTQKLKDKITFVLTVYPRLSPSMLHTGIGPNVQPQVWRPVLEQMIAEGTVLRTDEGVLTHLDQFRTFTVLKLNAAVYQAAKDRYGLQS